MNDTIEELIVSLSTDPFNPEINFSCAIEYQKLNQTASAVSFYLRAAEYGYETHPEITYTSLLKMAKCFEDQNDRVQTVSNALMQAVSYLPKRPEAYYLLSCHFEQTQQWQECYTWSNLGLEVSDNTMVDLPLQFGYIGKESFIFQKAISCWWIGRRKESNELFNLIITNYNNKQYEDDIFKNYKELSESNLKRMEK